MVFVKEIGEKDLIYSGIPINREQIEEVKGAADEYGIKQIFIVPLNHPLFDGRLDISIFFFNYEIKKGDAKNFRNKLWKLQEEAKEEKIIEAQV
ncbi:MAG: hypothetical protein WCQ96_05090 [Patescibacteria group bacterium]